MFQGQFDLAVIPISQFNQTIILHDKVKETQLLNQTSKF